MARTYDNIPIHIDLEVRKTPRRPHTSEACACHGCVEFDTEAAYASLLKVISEKAPKLILPPIPLGARRSDACLKTVAEIKALTPDFVVDHYLATNHLEASCRHPGGPKVFFAQYVPDGVDPETLMESFTAFCLNVIKKRVKPVYTWDD